MSKLELALELQKIDSEALKTRHEELSLEIRLAVEEYINYLTKQIEEATEEIELCRYKSRLSATRNGYKGCLIDWLIEEYLKEKTALEIVIEVKKLKQELEEVEDAKMREMNEIDRKLKMLTKAIGI